MPRYPRCGPATCSATSRSRPPFSGTPADVCEKTRRLLASTENVRFFILYAFYVCICNTMHSTTRLVEDYYAYPVCVCNKHQQLESACRIYELVVNFLLGRRLGLPVHLAQMHPPGKSGWNHLLAKEAGSRWPIKQQQQHTTICIMHNMRNNYLLSSMLSSSMPYASWQASNEYTAV